MTTVYEQGNKSSYELNENGGSWRDMRDHHVGGPEFNGRPRPVSFLDCPESIACDTSLAS